MRFRLEANSRTQFFGGVSLGFLVYSVWAKNPVECCLVAIWMLIIAAMNADIESFNGGNK